MVLNVKLRLAEIVPHFDIYLAFLKQLVAYTFILYEATVTYILLYNYIKYSLLCDKKNIDKPQNDWIVLLQTLKVIEIS